MDKLFKLIEETDRICAFTGAGVSTFCGIPDFRGPDGMYRDPDSARGRMVIINASPTPQDNLACLRYTGLAQFAEETIRHLAEA